VFNENNTDLNPKYFLELFNMLAEHDHTETIKIILRKLDKDLVLNMAVEKRQTKLVNIVLEAGADPKSKNWDSENLSKATRRGNKEIVTSLLKWGDNPKARESEALRLGCERGCEEIVQILLEAGADPNARETATLTLAAARNFEGIIKLLIKWEANPKARNMEALRLSAGAGFLGIVKILLDAGADSKNGQIGWNFLCAVENGDQEGVEVISIDADRNTGPNMNNFEFYHLLYKAFLFIV